MSSEPPSAPPVPPAPSVPAASDSPNHLEAVFVPRLPPSKPQAGDLTKLRELARQLNSFRRSTKGELPAEARIAIVTAVACGITRSAVAEAFQVSQHTVRNAIDRWETGQSTASRPRTGRPRKLKPDAEAAVVNAVRTSDATLNSLAADFQVSKGTIRRVLAKNKERTSASLQQMEAARQAAVANGTSTGDGSAKKKASGGQKGGARGGQKQAPQTQQQQQQTPQQPAAAQLPLPPIQPHPQRYQGQMGGQYSLPGLESHMKMSI